MPCMTFFEKFELGPYGQMCFACGEMMQLERMVELHDQMDELIAIVQAYRRDLRQAIDEHPAGRILNPSKRRKLDDDWSWHSWWGW